MKGISETGISISTERELEPSGFNTMELFKAFPQFFPVKNRQHIEYGFFEIDWNCGNKVLQKSFAEWLNQQRKELKKSGVRKKGSRGGLRDQLNLLGALRVKEHYPYRNLVDYTEQYTKPRLRVPAPYKNLPDLYAAAQDAVRIIECRCQTRGATLK